MFRKEGIFFPDEISRLLASPFALKTLTDEPVLTNTHVHDEELIPQFTKRKVWCVWIWRSGLDELAGV